MDISIYFESLQDSGLLAPESFHSAQLGNTIAIHGKTGFPDLDGIQIALIGVKEDRKAVNNKGCALAPDYVRKYF